MASSESSHLNDIDKNFCQCPICLEQYREPKQLPCLHRYCSDCLKQLIERNQGVNVISCPECRAEFVIPREGVDGFKTDFYMNNIIEYIQIQKSLKDEKLQECYMCSKKLKVTAYCFKCNGFLCKECHEIHIKSKSLKDHKQHALSLEDLKSKHMTLEKLSDLKEAPRCESHPEYLCPLCCKTCDNLPICVPCTYGSHANHQITEVKVLANEEKGKLKNQLTSLCQYKDRILTISQKVEKTKDDLLSNLRGDTENFQTAYEREVQTVKKEMKKIEDDGKTNQTEIENKKKRKLEEKRKQMDEEMKQLKEKYNKIFHEIERESKAEIDNLKQKHDEELHKNREKLESLEREFQTFNETIEKTQEEGLMKLQEVSKQIHSIMERYENVTSTGYSVLETSNDWTTVQCIPDICKAIEPLSEDMKREFPELDRLSRIRIRPEITEDEESPVTIEVIETNGWDISGMTSCGDGSIVITGCKSASNDSHITLINIGGKVLRQKKLKYGNILCHKPTRFCAYLSEFKVATVCYRNEIGVYDVRDDSYIRKNICDVTSSWPADRCFFCVATDAGNNHILVGGEYSRDVYVLDDQLNYHHTLTLPEMIKYPRDMTVSEGNLLVCDLQVRRAYVVSMEGQESKIIHEFTKPDFDRDDWNPLSVCTDSNGFIYILWMTGNNLSAGKLIVAQYTQDGRQLLKVKHVDSNDARCITTAKTGNTEKLFVGSFVSRKLHIYSLT